jgi:hypothetical protein
MNTGGKPANSLESTVLDREREGFRSSKQTQSPPSRGVGNFCPGDLSNDSRRFVQRGRVVRPAGRIKFTIGQDLWQPTGRNPHGVRCNAFRSN